MHMRMRRRNRRAVSVAVRAQQAGAFEQRDIMKNCERLSDPGDAAAFEHHTAIGNLFERVKVVGGKRKKRDARLYAGSGKVEEIGRASCRERV